jgi:hypothetical protein
VIVPYGIQTYRRGDLPRIRLTNLYVEQTPASRAQIALMARPGLEAYTELGFGPIRGMFATPGAVGDGLFTVSGPTLYNDNTALGTIPGSLRVSMASSAAQLLIANDTDLNLSDGATVAPVVFPDGAGVSSVAFINGYFLAARTGTQRFYWSTILDGSLWDGLDYASAERSPDNLVAIWVVSDQIWMFGEVTTEIWVPTGDGDVPFQRIEGRLYDQGCLARDTVAKMDNSIFWVGHDFKVYRGDSTPFRVSDFGIEQAIQESDIEDLRAWSFPWIGSLFYVLTTSSGTFAFNAATGQWSDFASFGLDSWRAHVGVFREQEVIGGDAVNGQLWKLSTTKLLDGEDPIERRWTVLLPNATPLDNIFVDASSGETPDVDADPIAELRLSRDGGNTFDDWRQASVGKMGQYRARCAWRRLGAVDGDGLVMDFRLTDPTVWRVSSIRMNEALGGRGRPYAA